MSGMLMNERFVAVFPSLVRALGSIESAVILQYLNFHATDGMVRITAQQIVEETGIALRTVQRRLTGLREQDLISDEGRATAFDPTLTFQINYDHPILSSRDRQRDAQSRQNGGHSSIKNEVRTNTSSPAVTPRGFDAWYNIYPRKKAKAQALRAYARAVENGADPDDLLSAIRRQAGRLGNDLRYCPYPATWLNGKRWLDDDEPPAKRKPGGSNWDRMRLPT
jgi:hypothetical protein